MRHMFIRPYANGFSLNYSDKERPSQSAREDMMKHHERIEVSTAMERVDRLICLI